MPSAPILFPVRTALICSGVLWISTWMACSCTQDSWEEPDDTSSASGTPPPGDSPTELPASATPVAMSPTPSDDCPLPTEASVSPTPVGPSLTPNPALIVPFTSVISGETWVESDACVSMDAQTCCADLHAELITSRAELEARYQEVLRYEAPPQTINFENDVAILSYNTWCAGGLNRLDVQDIVLTSSGLNVAELLLHDCLGSGMETRTFNVVTIPANSYPELIGHLAEEQAPCL